MSKKSKNKDKKIAAEYVVKRFDNPIIRNAGINLMKANPMAFKSLIWDLIGTKAGDKVIQKITDYHEKIINCGPITHVCPMEAIPDGKISWRDFDTRRIVVEHYEDSGYDLSIANPNDPMHKLYDIISMYIENEMIDNIAVQLELRSVYFSKSILVFMNADLLHKVNSSKELAEVLYCKILKELSNTAESIDEFINETPMTKPMLSDFKRIKDILSKCEDGSYLSGTAEWLAFRVYAIVALILATETGVAVHEYGYTPEYKSEFLANIGATSMHIGVHLVSVDYVDESDGSKFGEYRTKYPPMTNISQELMVELVRDLGDDESSNIIDEFTTQPFEYSNDDNPKSDAIVAFIADSSCSCAGNIVHVGQVKSDSDSWKSDKEIKICVPTRCKNIIVSSAQFDDSFITEFKKDAVIIDSQTMFYPIKNENGDILHKYYRLTPAEIDAVIDIRREMIPGGFFKNNSDEKQQKINKLLNTLQHNCTDVDLRAHDITLVRNHCYYEAPSCYLDCMDIALTDDIQEEEDKVTEPHDAATADITFTKNALVKYRNSDGVNIGMIRSFDEQLVSFYRIPRDQYEFTMNEETLTKTYGINAFRRMIIKTYPVGATIFRSPIQVSGVCVNKNPEVSVSLMSVNEQKLLENIESCIARADYRNELGVSDMISIMDSNKIDNFIIFQDDVNDDDTVYEDITICRQYGCTDADGNFAIYDICKGDQRLEQVRVES